MNIEEFREYALSLPFTTEDMPFDDHVVVYRLQNKIFACFALNRCDVVAMKCDPELALELRAHYPEISPAFHWSKKFWNDVSLSGNLQEETIRQLLHHAYNEVNKKLPKKDRVEPLATALNDLIYC